MYNSKKYNPFIWKLTDEELKNEFLDILSDDRLDRKLREFKIQALAIELKNRGIKVG